MNRAFALALAASTALTATHAFGADRALVIGIDDYAVLGLPQPLTSATRDAQAFAQFLQDEWAYDSSEITVLLNEQATSDAIMSALIDKLVSETKAEDRVAFYFAGLGTRLPDRSGTEADGLREALIAYDADSVLGKIPEDAIADILDIVADRKVTMVIDAGFDSSSVTAEGAVPRGLINPDAPVSNADTAKEPAFGSGAADRTIWNAAAPSQIAWETPEGGVLTTGFIEGIADRKADANANGTVSNAELLTYLRDRSSTWCTQNADCAATQLGLTPVFGGRVDGIAGREKTNIVVNTKEPKTEPLDGTPASYTETLGFVTDLFSPSNDAGLTLNINDGAALRIGDIVSFSIDANRDGTLVLLDVNPDGELVQIYPSPLSATGTTRMTAGETLTIPNGQSKNGNAIRIRVSEPAGKGFLLGLFIEDDLPALDSVLPADLAIGAIPNAGQYLYEIAQELLQLQANQTSANPVQWSAAYLPYEITR